MYTPDVLAFRQFYRMRLGKLVYRRIARKIAKLWPEMLIEKRYGDNTALAGIGYAVPYLKAFLHARNQQDKEVSAPRSQPAIACMPAACGVIPWPRNPKNGNKSLLVDEYHLPFADHSLDRILVAHMLEFTERPDLFLDEVSRVLKPSGKLMMIVPNRISSWASRDVTPFGYGRPFTAMQLETLLQEAQFHVSTLERLIFFLPIHSPIYTNFVRLIDKLFFPLTSRVNLRLFGGGVLLIEAEKRSFAMIPAFKRQPIRAKQTAKAGVNHASGKNRQ